jgi:hypothetical protein
MWEGHALEQSSAKAFSNDGLAPGAPSDYFDVYPRAGPEPENHGIALDRSVVDQSAPNL